MNNKDYFNYSKSHPESLFDPNYEKGLLVIPETINQSNSLTIANGRMIDLITAFQVLRSHNVDKNDDEIIKIIEEMETILDTEENINFTSFCQFFMVYDQTYSVYADLPEEQKREFIYIMLDKYCEDRHDIYKSHGYSNIVLQVMSDNYSHKRNGVASINKYVGLLSKHISRRIEDEVEILNEDDYFFLPDKGDKDLFECMLATLDIEMKSRENEQSKLPDLVFKHNDNYYIIELKHMKGDGGGQNKQSVEFIQFINFSERNENIHYITIVDGEYSNRIFAEPNPRKKKLNKIDKQRIDILKALDNNEGNYFLNTEGTIKFLDDLFQGD